MSKQNIRVHFNIDELNELLRDFYTITKIRIVAFDEDFKKLSAYPTGHSAYCEILRKDERAKAKCRECDLEGYKVSKKLRSIHIYPCYAGLMESVVPLMDGEIIVGYLQMGQVIMDDGQNREQKWKEVLPVVEEYNIDLEELKKCFWKKRRLTKQQLWAATKIMDACASHLYLRKAIVVREEDLSKRIERYIETHLWDELTVEILCEKFNIRRTKLYELSMYNFSDGIGQYIRKMRIKKAEELLQDTDKKIAEIAELVGFPDYNYFTKVFKKEKGITPRDYRRKLREE